MWRLVVMALAACQGGTMARPTPDAEVAADGRLPDWDARPAVDASVWDAEMFDATLADATIVDAASLDAASLDADLGDGCASPPTGGWAGRTKYFGRGSGPSQSHGADVTWTLVSTEACVDRYAPSGTAWVDNEGYECSSYEASAPIAATDGVLTIDRNTSPPTYTMNGTARWEITVGCSEPETVTVPTVWASYRGVIDADVFGGGHGDTAIYWEWTFTRIGADLPPPDGCSEPAEDTWTGTHSNNLEPMVATVTWTRVSTEGCVDRYQPSGTATFMINRHYGCTSSWIEPGHGVVEASDGFLEIDRSTNPPTFDTSGYVSWPATRYCTQEDGTTLTDTWEFGNYWDAYGPLDGDVVAGTLVGELSEHAWRLER